MHVDGKTDVTYKKERISKADAQMEDGLCKMTKNRKPQLKKFYEPHGEKVSTFR